MALVSRPGKPYIHISWLSRILGGHTCLWSPWARAHYTFTRYEPEGPQLAVWAAEHDALMRARKAELEENGWTVALEGANSFKLEGRAAVVAGKPDLVATMPGHTLIVDGKTGTRRSSDVCQVLGYLFAWPRCHTVDGTLAGEVHYKRNDERVPVAATGLTPSFQSSLLQLIQIVAGGTPPQREPSRDNCRFCPISECPDRFKERKGTEGAGILTSEW